MIFRQMFDPVSSTYTYLLADRQGGEALLIDPVMDRVEQYLQLIRELDLQLVMAMDTHIHADHVTAIGKLGDATRCATALGEMARAECVSHHYVEGEIIRAGDVKLKAVYTPGHTDDSYSFVMNDRVFTGDTLLIRGTGRTDFQNGDPGAQYDSLFNKLLLLPDNTLVYPAHDYEGRTCSTIIEEKHHNPRLQVRTRGEYLQSWIVMLLLDDGATGPSLVVMRRVDQGIVRQQQ